MHLEAEPSREQRALMGSHGFHVEPNTSTETHVCWTGHGLQIEMRPTEFPSPTNLTSIIIGHARAKVYQTLHAALGIRS